MTETLLRELLTEAEEMAQRHAEDREQVLRYGDREPAAMIARYERHTRSVIRRARKVLAEIIKTEGQQ